MPVDISLYSPEATSASKSILIEVARVLSSYKDYMVLSGGWAPYFVLERFGKGGVHCGSADIDLVLSPKLKSVSVYQTIVKIIEANGFSQVEESGEKIPYKFAKGEVELDFLGELETMEGLVGLMKVQRDLSAAIIRGSSIVFEHFFNHMLEGELPRGELVKTSINVSDFVGCITTKGLAFGGRRNQKDYYDVYMLLKHFKGGPIGAAKEIKPFTGDERVAEALDIIAQQFKTVRHEGPFNAAYFIEPRRTEERERMRADAFMTVRNFFDHLCGV